MEGLKIVQAETACMPWPDPEALDAFRERSERLKTLQETERRVRARAAQLHRSR